MQKSSRQSGCCTPHKLSSGKPLFVVVVRQESAGGGEPAAVHGPAANLFEMVLIISSPISLYFNSPAKNSQANVARALWPPACRVPGDGWTTAAATTTKKEKRGRGREAKETESGSALQTAAAGTACEATVVALRPCVHNSAPRVGHVISEVAKGTTVNYRNFFPFLPVRGLPDSLSLTEEEARRQRDLRGREGELAAW